MRPKKQTLDSQGNANWLPVDYRSNDFGIGIGVNLSDSGSLTYSIQHSFDNPHDDIDCVITRSGTTATATFKEPHGKAVGDSITVTHNREDNLKGTFDIASVPSDATLTYTVAATGSTQENAKAILLSVFEHDTLTGQTASANGGYILPPLAVRLVVSAYTSGQVTANYVFSTGNS